MKKNRLSLREKFVAWGEKHPVAFKRLDLAIRIGYRVCQIGLVLVLVFAFVASCFGHKEGTDGETLTASAAEAVPAATISHVSKFTQNSYSDDTQSATWTGTLYDNFVNNNYYPYQLYSKSCTLSTFKFIQSDSDYVDKSPISPTDFDLRPYIYCDSTGRPYLSYSVYSTITGKGRTVFKILVLGKDSQGNLHNFYTNGFYSSIGLNMGSFASSFDPSVSTFPSDFRITSTTNGIVASSDISTLESSFYPYSYGPDFFFMPIVLPARTSDSRDGVSGNIHLYPYFRPASGGSSNIILCDFPHILSQIVIYPSYSLGFQDGYGAGYSQGSSDAAPDPTQPWVLPNGQSAIPLSAVQGSFCKRDYDSSSQYYDLLSALYLLSGSDRQSIKGQFSALNVSGSKFDYAYRCSDFYSNFLGGSQGQPTSPGDTASWAYDEILALSPSFHLRFQLFDPDNPSAHLGEGYILFFISYQDGVYSLNSCIPLHFSASSGVIGDSPSMSDLYLVAGSEIDFSERLFIDPSVTKNSLISTTSVGSLLVDYLRYSEWGWTSTKLSYSDGYNAGYGVGFSDGISSYGSGELTAGMNSFLAFTTSFMETPFFGGFSISDMLYVVIGLSFVLFFLKMFR